MVKVHKEKEAITGYLTDSKGNKTTFIEKCLKQAKIQSLEGLKALGTDRRIGKTVKFED